MKMETFGMVRYLGALDALKSILLSKPLIGWFEEYYASTLASEYMTHWQL